jgi:ferredoxin
VIGRHVAEPRDLQKPAQFFNPPATNQPKMADKNNKVPENVPGAWYVDGDLCTPCRVCLDEAPDLLKYNDDESKVFFFKQPENEEEQAHAVAARDICPQAAIADDGE